MFRIRVLSFFLLCGALLGASERAETSFLRVWPQWRDAESFERIGEFFGGAENAGREIVRRSQAKERAGFYFLVRVKHDAPLAEAKFNLHVIRPGAPEAVTFSFPASNAKAGESVFQLGVTGADWPGGKGAQPVAWKLELVGTDGRVLAAEKSFLWELPAK